MSPETANADFGDEWISMFKKRAREKEANHDKIAESTNPGVIMTERSLSSRIIDKLLIISPGEGCLFATYSG